MKYLSLIAISALAFTAVSCGNSEKATTNSIDSISDTLAIQDTLTANDADTTATIEATATEETQKADEAKDSNNDLDAKVDKIVSMINEHISTVQSLKNEGIPSGSSMAFRSLEALPDYTGQLNKIKGQLSPEQKARIDEAEMKLQKLTNSWN